MTDNSFNQSINDASIALNAFADGPAKDAASTISTAFNVVGRDISNALTHAAKTGEFSIKSLAASIIKHLSSIAIDKYVTKPIDNILQNVISAGLPNFGARAGGGAVNAGGAFLVGERGPELFVPKGAGVIENGYGAAPVHIHINMANGSNLSDVKRSANQISAAMARAVEKGRNLL